MGKKIDISEIMLAFIAIILGLALTSTVAESIATAVTALTSYSTAAALVPLIATVWIITIVLIPVTVVIKLVR